MNGPAAALVLFAAACGAPARGGLTREPAPPPPPAPAPAPSAAEPVREPEPAAVARAGDPRPGDACVTVDVGLDLRALPTGTSTSGIDMFVAGQADAFAEAAGPGDRPELRARSGIGGFSATFRGAVGAAVTARCEGAVRSYLASAPRLPILMQPAATIVQPCRACP